MPLLDDILAHNKNFVESAHYEPLRTTRFPDKRVAILTCMDTRLAELLPAAMNLRQGDAKIIRTAGAVVSHPFGSIMRSLLVAVYELQVQEIIVVGHHDCGMAGLSCSSILEKAVQRGVSPDVLRILNHAGLNLEQWLVGFENVEDGVISSVHLINHHPLLPRDIAVHGMIIHPETGKLDLLVNGYEED